MATVLNNLLGGLTNPMTTGSGNPIINPISNIDLNSLQSIAQALQNMSGKTFTRFQLGDIISDISRETTLGTFLGDPTLVSAEMVTASYCNTISSSYIDVLYGNPVTGSNLFTIAYGSYVGSGSQPISANSAVTYAKRNYTMMANVLLPYSETKIFRTPDRAITHALFISVNQAHIKDKIDAGNWNIVLASGTVTRSLVDNSLSLTQSTIEQEYYYIVEGTYATQSTSSYYGVFYPNQGIWILDVEKLMSASFGNFVGVFNLSSSYYGSNCLNFFERCLDTPGGKFECRSVKKLRTTYYFVRIKNYEYNFSNNPTFFNQDTGDLVHPSMINNPTVYITTVGLYNDNNELLAVAKLSNPLKKDFTSEYILRILVDF